MSPGLRISKGTPYPERSRPPSPLPGRGWPGGPGEEFGQKLESQYHLTDLHQGMSRNQPFITSVMLRELSRFFPHSSSDPLFRTSFGRATFPPGEAFWWKLATFLLLICITGDLQMFN